MNNDACQSCNFPFEELYTVIVEDSVRTINIYKNCVISGGYDNQISLNVPPLN